MEELHQKLKEAEKKSLEFYQMLRRTNMKVDEYEAIKDELGQIFIYLNRIEDLIINQ